MAMSPGSFSRCTLETSALHQPDSKRSILPKKLRDVASDWVVLSWRPDTLAAVPGVSGCWTLRLAADRNNALCPGRLASESKYGCQPDLDREL